MTHICQKATSWSFHILPLEFFVFQNFLKCSQESLPTQGPAHSTLCSVDTRASGGWDRRFTEKPVSLPIPSEPGNIYRLLQGLEKRVWRLQTSGSTLHPGTPLETAGDGGVSVDCGGDPEPPSTLVLNLEVKSPHPHVVQC